MKRRKIKKRRLKKGFKLIIFIVLLSTIGIFLYNNNLKSNNNKNKNDNSIEVIDKKDTNIENKDKKLSLIAVGDVLIHESVYKDAYVNGRYDFGKMFKRIKPIISKYDLKFCNQESTIGGTALGISGYPSFNSPDEIGDEMVNLGFNLVSLANNHAFDKGENAILYSNSYWKTKDVITSGSYSSSGEANDIKVYEKKGIKYAFLSYTTSSNRKVTKDYLVNMYSAEKARMDIEKVKDKVDLIIVSMHWGIEYSHDVSESQKQIAEYLSSLGVNLIIGHHPHVVQPVTYVGNTLVIYSLGNFISNQLSINLDRGIGLMVGVDIIVNEDGVSFKNLYKELILAYALNSTNFEVIPFSQLNNNLLNNYESVNEKYMKYVNGE